MGGGSPGTRNRHAAVPEGARKMGTRRWLAVAAVLLVITASSARAAAPPYLAIDVGTLGGPNAFLNTPGRLVSESGVVVGSAETPALNPFAQECNGCHATAAFEFRHGTITDLGNLHGYNAGLFELNRWGDGAGFSETGVLDPLTVFPEVHAVMSRFDVRSRHGQLTDLGTLGGNESWSTGINDRGQISGFASNTTPDPAAQYVARTGLAPYPSATEWRAVLWQHGRIRDLGTLGGPDSFGGLLNERGQAAGESFTNSTANPATGLPTLDPFLWQAGHMQALGTLGGALGVANWLNNAGEVVGTSDLAGDQTAHPVMWNEGRTLDLGTLGGANGVANWVNEAGDIVGGAQTADQSFHGFLWHNGRMVDLPPVAGAPFAFANSINAGDEVVGNTTDANFKELAAVLWTRGQAYDLNSLIAPSAIQLTTAQYINDRGQIVATGVLPNGDQRVILLIPNHSATLPPHASVSTSAQAQSTSGMRRSRRVGRRPALMLSAHGAEAGLRGRNAGNLARREERVLPPH
jgi:probable HAF family extracellular repeat protein